MSVGASLCQQMCTVSTRRAKSRYSITESFQLASITEMQKKANYNKKKLLMLLKFKCLSEANKTTKALKPWLSNCGMGPTGGWRANAGGCAS